MFIEGVKSRTRAIYLSQKTLFLTRQIPTRTTTINTLQHVCNDYEANLVTTKLTMILS